MSRTTFFVKPVPPFRLDITAWALRRRPENAIDLWDGESYRRVVVLGSQPIEVEVKQLGSAEKPRLEITAVCAGPSSRMRSALETALQRLLGTQVDLSGFYRVAERQPKLGALVRRFRGLKPPRFPTVFECLLNAVTCQQISLAAGIQLLNHLAENYGMTLEANRQEAHAFPRPEDLAALTPETLRTLGFSRQKARALLELSRMVSARRLDLEALADLDDSAILERLCALRGVGRWSAEYVLLRGIGRLNVFPGDDVGARNNMQRYLGLQKPLDYKTVRRHLAAWKSWTGMLYFHLLLHGLEERGYLS